MFSVVKFLFFFFSFFWWFFSSFIIQSKSLYFGIDYRWFSPFSQRKLPGSCIYLHYLKHFPEGVILTRLLLFGSAGILKVWTGLIVSPFRSRIRIQDQIRIRLQDGYMEQDHRSVFTGRRSRPPDPVHINPSNRNHCSAIFRKNWLSNFPKFPFLCGTSQTDLLAAQWRTVYFSFLNN